MNFKPALYIILLVLLASPVLAGAEGQDGAALGIVIFVLVSTGALFALPFIAGRFSKNEFLDLLLKRCCWVLAAYLMSLNSAVVASVASHASIPLTSELHMYVFLFGWAGYLLTVFLVLKTLFDLLGMWKITKEKRRAGEE